MEKEIKRLEKIAKDVRINTFKAITNAGGGHYGGSLSVVEILTVLYFDESATFKSRFDRIMERIGDSLSLFSENVQLHWGEIKFKDYRTIKVEYKKSLNFCKNHFKHNPLDIHDPYASLIECILVDYRKLNQNKFSNLIFVIFF